MSAQSRSDSIEKGTTWTSLYSQDNACHKDYRCFPCIIIVLRVQNQCVSYTISTRGLWHQLLWELLYNTGYRQSRTTGTDLWLHGTTVPASEFGLTITSMSKLLCLCAWLGLEAALKLSRINTRSGRITAVHTVRLIDSTKRPFSRVDQILVHTVQFDQLDSKSTRSIKCNLKPFEAWVFCLYLCRMCTVWGEPWLYRKLIAHSLTSCTGFDASRSPGALICRIWCSGRILRFCWRCFAGVCKYLCRRCPICSDLWCNRKLCVSTFQLCIYFHQCRCPRTSKGGSACRFGRSSTEELFCRGLHITLPEEHRLQWPMTRSKALCMHFQ